MSLGIMQRFPPEHIFRLKQIGLAFFEKIATDQTIAGETQDFYQGLLVGFDRAVKLVDEEDGVRKLSLLKAKIATFIDVESGSSQQFSIPEQVPDDRKPSISRLSFSCIAQLKQIGTETYFDPNIEECIYPGETQDFYHGCVAAFDCAISLAGEKYAYAQISLLKTNAAYFIDLNNDRERQTNSLEMKALPSLKRYQKQGIVGALVQADSETLVASVEQDEVNSLFIQEESKDLDLLEQKDDADEDDTAPLVSSNSAIWQHQNRESENDNASANVQAAEQAEEKTVESFQQQRLEAEGLLVDILLDNYQKLKLGKLKVVEDWTAFLEEGETIRVICDREDRIVLRITLDGEVQSALSYGDAEKLSMTIREKAQESIASATITDISLDDDLSTDLASSTGAIDIQQIHLAEAILPTVQKAFEYVLNHAPDRVEETDEYTRVRVGDLYDLIVRESEGVSVSSLNVDRRGELIGVRGEDVVLAQGILSEDVEFWTAVAERLNRIDAMSENGDMSANDRDMDKSKGIEI